MENITIDNQQATLAEIAWFAGFFDGEGSLGIYGYKRYKNEGYSYTPKLQLASTNAYAIKYCVDILNKIGVNPKIYQKEPQKKNHKEAWQIYFTKFSDMIKVLPIIKDYLIIKKPHAELTLSFVRSRIEKGINRGRNKNINTYDNQEKELIANLRKMNHRGVLNDYTQNTIHSDDIV
jgi:hypothetical protein